MINKLDKKYFNFDFLWMLRGLMIQTIKMERWFRSDIVNDNDQEYHNHKPQTDPWHREE